VPREKDFFLSSHFPLPALRSPLSLSDLRSGRDSSRSILAQVEIAQDSPSPTCSPTRPLLTYLDPSPPISPERRDFRDSASLDLYPRLLSIVPRLRPLAAHPLSAGRDLGLNVASPSEPDWRVSRIRATLFDPDKPSQPSPVAIG
jgi:hypothetical protein